jgi:hypothetical protein
VGDNNLRFKRKEDNDFIFEVNAPLNSSNLETKIEVD